MRWTLVGMFCLVVTLAVPTIVIGQQPLSRVSVDDALQLALRQNPTLRAQQAALTSTKA